MWVAGAAALGLLSLFALSSSEGKKTCAVRPDDPIEIAIGRLVDDVNSYDAIPGTWAAGGCCILAHALQDLVGGELWVVSSSRYEVEHVLLKLGDKFYDARGAAPADKIIERAFGRDNLPKARLRRYRDSYDLGSIACSRGAIEVTKDRLISYGLKPRVNEVVEGNASIGYV